MIFPSLYSWTFGYFNTNSFSGMRDTLPVGNTGVIPTRISAVGYMSLKLKCMWLAIRLPSDGVSRENIIYSGTSVYVRFGISPTWYTSCLDAKKFAWYTTFVWNTTRVLELVWVKMSHDSSQQGKVRLNFHLLHLIAFLFMYFSIKQCLNYFIQPYQCTI
jgi:hypothetical protein